MRTVKIYLILSLQSFGAAATAMNQGATAPDTPLTGPVPAPIVDRLARQPCTWPHRYRGCTDACDRQEIKFEERGSCIIDIRPNAYSSCKKRHVDTIKACNWRCRADYCPQFKP